MKWTPTAGSSASKSESMRNPCLMFGKAAMRPKKVAHDSFWASAASARKRISMSSPATSVRISAERGAGANVPPQGARRLDDMLDEITVCIHQSQLPRRTCISHAPIPLALHLPLRQEHQ